jgi:hypothetical protein
MLQFLGISNLGLTKVPRIENLRSLDISINPKLTDMNHIK